MNLEQELNTALVSFTDQPWQHPNKYPEFIREYYPAIKGRRLEQKTLYVACAERPYTKIMESVYEGLTGVPVPFFQITKDNRKLLYKLYEDNKEDIQRKQYWKPWWK